MKIKLNINLIENFIKEKKITKTKFCKMCKISYSVYLKIMQNNLKIRLINIIKIANLLDLKIEKLVCKLK